MTNNDPFTYKKPMDMLNSDHLVKICAPMVRYSKLAFRMLVRNYGCDLAFTPMIVSNSFVQSLKARDCEFTTNSNDRPLIVQFAANNAKDFADAAEIVQPYADGIDLNCGCPQRWAIQEGYGVSLLSKPELLTDIVRQTKMRVEDPDFTVSIKLRINHDMRKTVSLCQQAERAGVSWIAVHGRTPDQRSTPVNIEAIRTIKDSVRLPVIANGDIRSLGDAEYIQQQTGVHGVMAARGILENPAMFAGYDSTPPECIRDWLNLSLALGTPYAIFHHHLMDMLDHALPRSEKRLFNCLSSTAGVIDFLKERYDVAPIHTRTTDYHPYLEPILKVN